MYQLCYLIHSRELVHIDIELVHVDFELVHILY